MLLAGLQPGFEILHGEFQWNVGNSLTMTYQIAVMRARQKPRNWEIRFSYPAEEATAVRAQATSAERQRFTLMVRANIAEWLEGRPSIIESARLVKSEG
jgi:hypothetical protein